MDLYFDPNQSNDLLISLDRKAKKIEQGCYLGAFVFSSVLALGLVLTSVLGFKN